MLELTGVTELCRIIVDAISSIMSLLYAKLLIKSKGGYFDLLDRCFRCSIKLVKLLI